MFAVVVPTLAALLLAANVAASSCIAMDADFNLLVFGVNGKDYSVGQQSSWTSTPATEITASGRPPFDGTNTTCYLSQFLNAIYVLSADSANPANVYIYDAATKAWSQQAVSTDATGSSNNFDPTNFVTILDHDTNVFYALSGGEMFFLNMMQITEGTTTAVPWTDVGKPSFDVDGYQPVMAIAQNHVHFLNVPGSQPGSAFIFVIHFSFFQPDPQSYPSSSGQNFPVSHGQATSFFQADSGQVQEQFAFIPDDGSNTYVINVETNTTQVLAGPTIKDSAATYFAGNTSLVQLTSSGQLAFLPFTDGDASANSAATWTTLTTVPTPTSSSSSGPSGSSSSGSHSSSGSSSSTSSGSSPSNSGSSGSTGSSGNNNGALQSVLDFRLTVGATFLLGFALVLLA